MGMQLMHVHIFEHIFKAWLCVNCDGATCSWPAISHLTLRLAAARLSELDHHSCSMATSTVYISLGMVVATIVPLKYDPNRTQ